MKKTIRKITRPIKNNVIYGDSDYDPVEYLVFEDRQLVLLVISKVACTSIKATIGKSYGIDYQSSSGLDIHHNKNWKRFFGKLPDKYGDFKTAAFVRNPFSRLVSCYIDRVLYNKDHEDFKKYYFANYPYMIPENCSFPEFVDIVSQIPDSKADRHFKSQFHTISKINRPLDFLGKFENLKVDWREFAEMFDFDVELERLNPGNREAKDVEKDFRKYFDEECFLLTRDRYAADIEDFSFSEKAEELLAFIQNKND